MSHNAQQGGQGISKRAGCAVAAVVVIVLYLIVYWATDGLGFTDDNEFYGDESENYSEYQNYLGRPIPRFTPQDERSLSQALAEAERRYGICFGWELTDGSMDAESATSDSGQRADPPASFDEGSSRGPDVPAETCQRWVEVRATVAYTSESSESWSGVDLMVWSSGDIPSHDLPDPEQFADLGITAEQFIDAPVPTTGHAALALPLLLTQTGALQPQPVQEDSEATKPERPLPPAESEGSTAWVWVGILAALTAVAAGLGIVAIVRRKSGDGSGPPDPPPPGAINPTNPGPQGPGPPQGPPPGYPPQGQPPQDQRFQAPPPGLPYRGGPPPGPPGSHPWPPQGQPPHGQPPQGPPPAPR